MNRRIDVSIIMGVYNAEPYIRRCMDSLVDQTLADIEIIAVDDGSSDGSEDIVRDYASQDDRIRVLVHSDNRGPGAARNTGLEAARGTCIRFVDNDDCLPLDATHLLFDVYRRVGSDVVRGRVDRIGDGQVEPIPWMPRLDEAFNVPFAENRNLWAGYGAAVAYLFDRAFVAGKGLRFREDLRIGEDAVWNACCLTLAGGVSVIDASG